MKKYRVNVQLTNGMKYSLIYDSRKSADDCASYLKEGHSKIKSVTTEELED